jgi:hypothetical protein
MITTREKILSATLCIAAPPTNDIRANTAVSFAMRHPKETRSAHPMHNHGVMDTTHRAFRALHFVINNWCPKEGYINHSFCCTEPVSPHLGHICGNSALRRGANTSPFRRVGEKPCAATCCTIGVVLGDCSGGIVCTQRISVNHEPNLSSRQPPLNDRNKRITKGLREFLADRLEAEQNNELFRR